MGVWLLRVPEAIVAIRPPCQAAEIGGFLSLCLLVTERQNLYQGRGYHVVTLHQRWRIPIISSLWPKWCNTYLLLRRRRDSKTGMRTMFVIRGY